MSIEITFRCPPEWVDILPRPVRGTEALPEWLRTMPATADSDLLGAPVRTLKHCPPLIDAMGAGWLMPLAADVEVSADGRFDWNWSPPPTRFERLTRAPLGLHVSAQAAGSPIGKPGQLFLKFMNFWTVETPPGWSVLFTHPASRTDLPFRTLSGLVDCDRFSHGLVHFPAIWTGEGFVGRLPAGTPVAQLIPVPRGVGARFGTLDGGDGARFEETQEAIAEAPGGYRKHYRVGGRSAD
ncbi:hypothetical protein KAJ83_03390 [Marivibrio halodurans]|uniref:Uncharacterized protein n=1 Tax=Marivibrio halodurans TaxID=2039722 RepID=A0A8J7RWK4_9PROT|nr:hypothetical protein [Marivibrio halodurans]MBP5856037.1 hypothetical protein [Marivibrio halodurans]